MHLSSGEAPERAQTSASLSELVSPRGEPAVGVVEGEAGELANTPQEITSLPWTQQRQASFHMSKAVITWPGTTSATLEEENTHSFRQLQVFPKHGR